jgi:Telomere resolvase
MSATTEQLVEWLQRNKDPEKLIRWLCKRGLDYKTLCHELEHITNLWCEVYGDNAVKESVAYKSGVQRIKGYLQRKDNSIVQLVTKSLQLPFHQQYKLQAHGMLHNYTGCAALDALLNELVVLPSYIQGLRVTCRTSKSTTDVRSTSVQESSAKCGSTSVPQARVSVTGPPVLARSRGAKRKRMPSPNTDPAEDSNVAKYKVSKVLQAVDMQAQLSRMVEVLKYSRAKPFELACALAFVSGRSLAELMALGHFSSSEGNSRSKTRSPCPQVLFALQHNRDSKQCYSIPLLCDNSTFLAGIERLRQMKVVQGKQCKDINKSHCKTANTAAKNLLGCSTAVFTDLRVAYAALTFELYGNESQGSNEALESQMHTWLVKCLPLSKLGRSPSFLTQCCSTYLALSQLPAARHQEASVDIHYAQHVAPSPDERALAQSSAKRVYISDTRSIVLRLLPLLVRMYGKSAAPL